MGTETMRQNQNEDRCACLCVVCVCIYGHFLHSNTMFKCAELFSRKYCPKWNMKKELWWFKWKWKCLDENEEWHFVCWYERVNRISLYIVHIHMEQIAMLKWKSGQRWDAIRISTYLSISIINSPNGNSAHTRRHSSSLKYLL